MGRTLGENIKHYRKSKGYSQEKLANKTGLSKMSIRRYEAGERQPSIDSLKKIAAALECKISDIDESIYAIRYQSTPEEIERAKQNAEARRLIAKRESGENITDEERQIITDCIERWEEGLPRLRESIERFSDVINEWGEHILVTRYRELNINGKREAVKRIDELTEIPRYTAPDPDDTPQD